MKIYNLERYQKLIPNTSRNLTQKIETAFGLNPTDALNTVATSSEHVLNGNFGFIEQIAHSISMLFFEHGITCNGTPELFSKSNYLEEYILLQKGLDELEIEEKLKGGNDKFNLKIKSKFRKDDLLSLDQGFVFYELPAIILRTINNKLSAKLVKANDAQHLCYKISLSENKRSGNLHLGDIFFIPVSISTNDNQVLYPHEELQMLVFSVESSNNIARKRRKGTYLLQLKGKSNPNEFFISNTSRLVEVWSGKKMNLDNLLNPLITIATILKPIHDPLF